MYMKIAKKKKSFTDFLMGLSALHAFVKRMCDRLLIQIFSYMDHVSSTSYLSGISVKLWTYVQQEAIMFLRRGGGRLPEYLLIVIIDNTDGCLKLRHV